MPHSTQVIKLPYPPRPFRNAKTGEISELYYPTVNTILTFNHRLGMPIEALIDSGSDINLFPADYALAYLGMNERSLKKGEPKVIVGIGDTQLESFGHRVRLELLGKEYYFNTVVYFSLGHNSIPLLGRSGFFDRFERVAFDEQSKTVELKTLST